MLDIFEKLHPKKVVMLLMLMLLSFVAFTQTPPKVYNYKGKDYTILHGPKGGHYIILEDKTKHYLPTLDVDDKTGEVTYKGVKYKPQLGPKVVDLLLLIPDSKYIYLIREKIKEIGSAV